MTPEGLRSILLVDDDPFIRAALPSLLQEWFPGVDVMVAASPAEADDHLESRLGADLLVLCDYNLQDSRNGVDVLRRAADLQPKARRILFSGHLRHELRDLDSAAVHGFAEKPFRLEDLQAPLRDLVSAPIPPGAHPHPASRTLGGHALSGLQNQEVLQALVTAERKGEGGRAALLYQEAGRRGQEPEARAYVRDSFAWQNHVLELVATRAPLARILEEVAIGLQSRIAGSHVVAMRTDATGLLLKVAAAATAPSALLAALQHVPVVVGQAPCATAALHAVRVETLDLHDAGKWPAVAAVARQEGLQAAWSTPINAQDGKCHGTLAVYRRVRELPTTPERQVIDLAASLARMAIEAAEDHEALEMAQQRKAAILEAALDAIVSMDHRGLVTEWNAGAQRIFGYARDEAVGRTMGELIVPPAYREAHWNGLRRYLQTGQARVLGRPIEITAMRKGGGEFPVELAIVALPTQPPSFTGFIRDLTQEHERREQLRSTAERLRAIFDQVGVGVVQMELDGRFLFANGRYAEILHRDLGSIDKLRLEDVTHPDDVAKDEALLRRVVQDGKPVVTESRLLRPDGSWTWVRRSLSLVRDGKGDPALVVGIVHEINDQKQFEARLRELNATLESRVEERTHALVEANQDLEAFSYAVSHDLRAPLRAIQYHITTAGRAGDDASKRDEALGLANKALLDMNERIEGLLQLASVARGALQVGAVDLASLAEAAIQGLRRDHPERQVEARIQRPLIVHGDEALLRSVIENLVSNAWKFSAERVPALIEVGRAPEGHVFVRDNGSGFDPKRAARLFQPFERIGPAQGPAGMGIGLATVRRIVERHGGRVWATSSPGNGAEFCFSLP